MEFQRSELHRLVQQDLCLSISLLDLLHRRTILVFATVLVLATQPLLVVLADNLFHSAYALGPPPPSIGITFHFDSNTAKGFEKFVLNDDNPQAPEFVLGRGRTGTMNITFTAFKETESIKENDTARIPSVWYGGSTATNFYQGGSSSKDLPNGITTSVEPQNITLAPGSKATVTLRISAAPDAEIRKYSLQFSFRFMTPSYPRGMTASDSTVLTVVEGTAPTTITTITTTTAISTTEVTATSYVNRTLTETFTQTITSTSTATLSSLLTTTATNAIKQAMDSSTYAWAASATIAAVVLAAVLVSLLRRTSHP